MPDYTATDAEMAAVAAWQKSLPPVKTTDDLRREELIALKQRVAEHEAACTLAVELETDPETGEKCTHDEIARRNYNRAMKAIAEKKAAPVVMSESELQSEYMRQAERLAGIARIRERDSRPDVPTEK